jgi:glycosyltransferase involved in cell wall biosynthesis
MSELVSLVMPAWNVRPAWLREAVESALAQRGCEVEVILVDDGSDTSVAEALGGLEDTRLQLVRVEHGGTSRALTVGVAASSGTWLRFVGADDVLPPDSTAHLLELAAGADVIAYGATELCDEFLVPRATLDCRLTGDVVRDCLLNRFDVTVPALLFPRSVVDRVGEWDPEIVVCQDWDYVLRALEYAPVRGDTRPVYRYRQHTSSASAGLAGSDRSRRLSEQGMHLVVMRYFERHPEQAGTELESRAVAQVELIIARSHREEYLAHLGRARRGDAGGVLRELAVFARLVVARAAVGLRGRGRAA